MREPTFIDNLFAIQQAVREGKEWEYYGSLGKWHSPMNLSLEALNILVKEGHTVRLKPEPPKPRWWSKPSDVPGPVCWIRPIKQRSLEMMIVVVWDNGVGYNDTAGIQVAGWDIIQRFEWSPDLSEESWKPCTTEEQP